MNTTTAYTPLECLLLFQSLVHFGAEEQDFARISDLLTNNSLIKDGPTYDPQRLSSDALRQLYLQLVRDELKADEQDGQEDGGQMASKKRKLQSPPVQSIKDAQEYKDKLPLLADRLYARYRDYMVRAIQDDERRYAMLHEEIGQIERGEWDERILKEDKALANKNNAAAAEEFLPKTNGVLSQPLTRETPAVTAPQPELPKDQVSTPAVPLPQVEVLPEGFAINDVLNTKETLPSPPKAPEPTRNGNVPPPPNHQTGSNGPQGPSPLQTGPQQLQQPGAWKWETPYGPQPPHGPPNQTSPYPPNGPYPQFNGPQYPNQGYAPPPKGSFSSPHGLPSPHPHVPSSPVNPQHPHVVLLPPPNTIHRPASSPGLPLDALAHAASHEQYRATAGSPMLPQGPPSVGYQPPYHPQHHPLSGNGPPQWNQQFMPQYQAPPPHYHYPPNQPTPPFAPQPNLIQPENRQYNSPYNASQGPRHQIPAHGQTPRTKPSLPHTPLSQGVFRDTYVTGSGTKWTPMATGLTPRTQHELNPPLMEPISPILRPQQLPTSSKKPTKKQAQKTEQAKPAKTPKRGAQRTRAGSTASSVIAGSYRSQSVMSHADELSMDNEVPSRHVKEEVATPMGVEDTGDTTADESSTLPRLHSRSGPSPRHSTKRKRATSIPFESRSSGPATHVLWTRAFPKISASALESISGHRNASTFAAPVKERDAPGYKGLILQPQDLKSIRTAITAGHRAATQAAPEDMNPNASSAWLPITEDLIPPKGIINYAQLEKELMRMFANAVMFNADPDRGFGRKWQGIGKGKGDSVGYEIDEDGVVKDTRAMFSDVEKVVGSLRSAERRSEEMRESSVARAAAADDDEVDELAGDGESHAGNTGSVAKRRRKA